MSSFRGQSFDESVFKGINVLTLTLREAASLHEEVLMSDRTEKQYQVKELADISGVSVRTLHYYEEIGLLAPGRTGSGYRIYDDDDIRRLQEILAMRACAMPLAEIKELLAASEGDAKSALMGHLQRLQAQKRNLEGAIAKTHGALSLIEGMEAMNDAQKFEELKRASIETFETTYGQEAQPPVSLPRCTPLGFRCTGPMTPTQQRLTSRSPRVTWPMSVSSPTTTAPPEMALRSSSWKRFL